MKPKAVCKIIIDVLMTLALLFLMGYQFWGDAAHEWAGAGMFLLFLLHHILNRQWHQTLFRGKYTLSRVLSLAIDLLLLLTMLGLMASGVLLSSHVFAFLPLRGGMSFARLLHMASSYWGFVLMALHLGLHWGMFVGLARRAMHLRQPSRVRRVLLPAISAGIAVYGLTALIRRDILTYLLVRTRFVFLDFTERYADMADEGDPVTLTYTLEGEQQEGLFFFQLKPRYRTLGENPTKEQQLLNEAEDSYRERPAMPQEVKKPGRPAAAGDTVELLSMGVSAEVEAVNRDGSLSLRAGAMHLTARQDEVRVVEKPKKKKAAASSPGGAALRAAAVPAEVDLRGMDTLEAVPVLERYIDAAVMGKLKTVTVIHGKGTGALRAAVQQALKRSKAVKSYRLGRYGEGESGVTVVELK